MILALKTSEIAAHRRNGERGRSGIEMKNRFFLDGVDIERDGTAKDKGIKLSFPVLPHSANSLF